MRWHFTITCSKLLISLSTICDKKEAESQICIHAKFDTFVARLSPLLNEILANASILAVKRFLGSAAWSWWLAYFCGVLKCFYGRFSSSHRLSSGVVCKNCFDNNYQLNHHGRFNGCHAQTEDHTCWLARHLIPQSANSMYTHDLPVIVYLQLWEKVDTLISSIERKLRIWGSNHQCSRCSQPIAEDTSSR